MNADLKKINYSGTNHHVVASNLVKHGINGLLQSGITNKTEYYIKRWLFLGGVLLFVPTNTYAQGMADMAPLHRKLGREIG
jgi:hypothetical protein